MRIIQDQIFGLYPNFFMHYRPALSALPNIVNVSGDCVVGNSGGFGTDSICSAYGEYIERFHFYNEVAIDVSAKLDEMNSEEDANKLLKAINQIKRSALDPANYTFDLTQARNIFNGHEVFIPTTLLTLSQGNSPDREFIPFIDSCGQAVHITIQDGFESALNEFVERQALISAWLGGDAAYAIEMLPRNDINEIYTLLTQHGRLIAYDLNKNLPGYSIILFYFSNSDKDNVKYSVGMASDSNPREAFLRALNELWQSYIFIYLNAEQAENLDERYQYLNQLLSFNHHETEKAIPFHLKESMPVVSLTDFFSFPSQTLLNTFQQLHAISPAIYSYQGEITLFGRRFNFCKVVSPDFYLHMGITKPLNFNNTFADSLKIKITPPVLEPIPFP